MLFLLHLDLVILEWNLQDMWSENSGVNTKFGQKIYNSTDVKFIF